MLFNFICNSPKKLFFNTLLLNILAYSPHTWQHHVAKYCYFSSLIREKREDYAKDSNG